MQLNPSVRQAVGASSDDGHASDGGGGSGRAPVSSSRPGVAGRHSSVGHRHVHGGQAGPASLFRTTNRRVDPGSWTDRIPRGRCILGMGIALHSVLRVAALEWAHLSRLWQRLWRRAMGPVRPGPKVSPKSAELSNNGLQLTKATRCAPLAVRSWGQSLRVAFAAEPECSTAIVPAGRLSD